MKKIPQLLCLILLLGLSVGCSTTPEPTLTEVLESKADYSIASNGDLQIKNGDQMTVLEINALPDAQILMDEDQRLLLLSDPTDQYQHGILGDKIEAASVTLVQLSDDPEVIGKFYVPEEWVIESILPIWSDWDGDGQREIVLTLSNSTQGAKLVLYDEEGTQLAQSLPIGKGSRWRHALEIASFGEDGQKLLVDVQTPHIGGIVSYYSWDKANEQLYLEATLPGYSTHDIGSRAMNMYTVVGDEENQQDLLILPIQSKTELAALRFVEGEIREEWRLPLGGRLIDNLEVIDKNGMPTIRAIIDGDQEVLLELP